MSTTTDYRVNFRIRQNDDVSEELNRLAAVISKKYNEDVRIILRRKKK